MAQVGPRPTLHAIAILALVSLAGCGEPARILVYHSVGERAPSRWWVDRDTFRDHMEYLLAQGHSTVTASELDRVEAGEKRYPARPVLVTFDDGYENFYLNAYPVLKSLGVRATMFLISSRIGDDEATRVTQPSRFLIWPEILEMQANGIEFQSHTVSHPRLAKVDRRKLEHELGDSKRVLEAHLRRPVTVLAYPFGSSDAVVQGSAERHGYRSAHSTNRGVNGPYDRLRIGIHAGHTGERFSRSLRGSR